MNPLYVWKDSLDGGWSIVKSPSTYTGQHNTQKDGHASMPQMGFESSFPVSEWSTLHCHLKRHETALFMFPKCTKPGKGGGGARDIVVCHCSLIGRHNAT
jgi:hypothetical protein